jgi:hypothetical protein
MGVSCALSPAASSSARRGSRLHCGNSCASLTVASASPNRFTLYLLLKFSFVFGSHPPRHTLDERDVRLLLPLKKSLAHPLNPLTGGVAGDAPGGRPGVQSDFIVGGLEPIRPAPREPDEVVHQRAELRRAIFGGE